MWISTFGVRISHTCELCIECLSLALFEQYHELLTQQISFYIKQAVFTKCKDEPRFHEQKHLTPSLRRTTHQCHISLPQHSMKDGASCEVSTFPGPCFIILLCQLTYKYILRNIY